MSKSGPDLAAVDWGGGGSLWLRICSVGQNGREVEDQRLDPQPSCRWVERIFEVAREVE